MWDEAQTLYLEEVLGLSPETLRRALAVQSGPELPQTTPAQAAPAKGAPTKVQALILTPPLGELEQALLTKILASVNISDLPVVGMIPATVEATHVLAFNGSSGVNSNGVTTFWGLPLLAQMCGTGPEINAHKRETWAQLKKFRDAYNAIAR